MMRLILFDIDGTLLNCGKQVGILFLEALKATYGTCKQLEGYSFAGRTDPGIVMDLMTHSGVPRETILEGLPEMRQLYLKNLAGGLQKEGMTLLPGAVEVLEQLAEDRHTTLALLTGNWRQGARIKLSRFDLNRFFSFGAFGNDGFDRRELPPAALERALTETGQTFSPQQTLIVGDSVRDVDCGQANGVSVLAVATGYTAAEDLAAAGARWVSSDLREAAKHIAAFCS